MVDLSNSVSAYLGIYKDAHNFFLLESELRTTMKGITAGILTDLFGENALEGLSSDAKDFLGIGQLDFPEPINDLDV